MEFLNYIHYIDLLAVHSGKNVTKMAKELE